MIKVAQPFRQLCLPIKYCLTNNTKYGQKKLTKKKKTAVQRLWRGHTYTREKSPSLVIRLSPVGQSTFYKVVSLFHTSIGAFFLSEMKWSSVRKNKNQIWLSASSRGLQRMRNSRRNGSARKIEMAHRNNNPRFMKRQLALKRSVIIHIFPATPVRCAIHNVGQWDEGNGDGWSRQVPLYLLVSVRRKRMTALRLTQRLVS